jgi:acyl-coenzyme A synthetase/AMP-(fatty) acid ligase
MKFFQESEGEVVAKIVRAPKYPDEEVRKEFQDEMEKVLTEDEFKIQYEFVESLPLTHRGKLHFLDQKIPLDFEDIVNAGF